jgi:carboxyl-terminal processing protease
LTNLFLKEGVIYTSKSREGKIVQEIRANSKSHLTNLPLVVLVNGSTAGAAEIVAGALKDHSRAKLVGEKTFGVGSLQKKITLKSGAMIILSTAKFFTPSGQMIQQESIRRAGVRPHVQAPDRDRRQDLLVESYYDVKEEAEKYLELREKIRDEQLEKALEVIKGETALDKAA